MRKFSHFINGERSVGASNMLNHYFCIQDCLKNRSSVSVDFAKSSQEIIRGFSRIFI
jgi:hypothetical protein